MLKALVFVVKRANVPLAIVTVSSNVFCTFFCPVLLRRATLSESVTVCNANALALVDKRARVPPVSITVCNAKALVFVLRRASYSPIVVVCEIGRTLPF